MKQSHGRTHHCHLHIHENINILKVSKQITLVLCLNLKEKHILPPQFQ